MIKRLLRWLRGYLLVELVGDYPEHFCNLCSTRNIAIWLVSHKNEAYRCYMSLKGYKDIKPIAKKTHTIPYIKKRIGFPFFVQTVRKRKGFFIGILVFCFLLFFMSRFIWDIGIEGSHKYTQEQMTGYLKSIGVYSGKRISDIDCPFIEQNIRKDFGDIGWVSAQIKGTRLIVSIEETVNPLLEEEKRKTNLKYAHITAQKDGIIYHMVTRSGTPKVEMGSVVKKGDILISGIVPVIGDDQTVIDNRLVLADGTIEIKSFYEYEDSFPLKYQYKKYTNHSKRGYSLQLWNKKIFSFGCGNSYSHYDIIKEVKTMKILRNFYLPIQITKSRKYEYKIEDAVYTEQEAKEKALKQLMRYLENLNKNQIEVIENRVNVTFKDGYCYAKGKIIVTEPAWKYTAIEDAEWRLIKIDELDGNNP